MRPDIRLRVKGKVYKTLVRPAMVYGAETWTVKKAQEKKLDNIKNDLSERELSGEDAQDRTKWRRRHIDHT